MALETLFSPPCTNQGGLAGIGDPKQGLHEELSDPVDLSLLDAEMLDAEIMRLSQYIIRLRCGDPPKGTWAQALVYLTTKLNALTTLSVSTGGTEDGWPDTNDPFAAGDQIKTLWEDLEELQAGPYPMPLPPDCRLLPEANFDPFAAGRLYNGKINNGQLRETPHLREAA